MEKTFKTSLKMLTMNSTSKLFPTAFPADEIAFEDLKKRDLERRRLVHFAQDSYTLLYQWATNAMLRHLLFDLRVWGNLGIYAITRWLECKQFVDQKSLTISPLSVVGGLVSFIVVFYVGHSYNRFTAQYNLSMTMEGRIFDCAMIARAYMSQHKAWQLYRYMNAAHVLGYCGLSTAYNDKNFFLPSSKEWALLTEEEVARMEDIGTDIGGSPSRELCAWCVQIIRNEKVGSTGEKLLLDQVLRFRAALGGLFDFKDQPMPLVYRHFVYFATHLFLPLFAYTVGNHIAISEKTTSHELMGFGVVYMYTTIILGLIYICEKMQDPYGNDYEDLSVMHYITFSMRMSGRILCAHAVPETDAGSEANRFTARESFLGSPFNWDRKKKDDVDKADVESFV